MIYKASFTDWDVLCFSFVLFVTLFNDSYVLPEARYRRCPYTDEGWFLYNYDGQMVPWNKYSINTLASSYNCGRNPGKASTKKLKGPDMNPSPLDPRPKPWS